MTRSQKFIAENKRALVCGPDYFNPDTELMPLAEFSKAKIKCLFIFPTPSDVKAVSTTKEALNDYVRTHCPDVFVDFAYIPNQSDAKLYEKYNMPLAIGNITHLDPSHFDVVGFSISILSEVVSTPAMMYSFRKCATPILTTWSERKDLSVNKTPIFFAGGITASCGDIMFGDLGDGRQSFLDFLYLGECDKEKVVFDALLEAKQKDLTVQEYIDTLFVNDFIYQPQAYEVKFNDKNQIISNKKINPKAQDFVRPYMPYELNDDLGIGRSIINANGDGVGVSQVQASLGCSGGSACNFCHEGNYCGPWIEKSHDLYVSQARESKKYSAAYKHKPYSFNCNYVTDYKGLLYKLMQLFPKVTFINMRLEELGRDVDALKIMKLIGSNRISAPMEGISPRIQNNLFNKCLSEESLNNFMMDMVHARLTDIKCVTKEALTPIPGRGLLNQEQLETVDIIKFLGKCQQKTKRLKFTRGVELEGTLDHRVLVKPEIKEENFKEFSKLKEGDIVYLSIGKECYGDYKHVTIVNKTEAYTPIKDTRTFDVVIDEKIAEMLGWCTGDGSVETTVSGNADRVRFYFASDELDVADRIKSTLIELGYLSSTNWHTEKVFQVNSYHKNFAIFMENLIGSKAYSKRVPREILESPKSVQIAYLRGLMGADGTICNIKKGKVYHSSICLTLANKDIISTVQQMLFNMGIVSHIREGKSKCQGKVFKTFSLIVLQQEQRKYMDVVGFLGRKDSYQLCDLPEKGLRDSIKSINGFIPVKVKSIEDSEAVVYKYQTLDHTVITNSVQSHNCGLIFSGYEEDEDYQWICDFVDSFKKKASNESGNFPFRAKATPLVHYQLTPMEYLERRSAKKSMLGEHWLTDDW